MHKDISLGRGFDILGALIQQRQIFQYFFFEETNKSNDIGDDMTTTQHKRKYFITINYKNNRSNRYNHKPLQQHTPVIFFPTANMNKIVFST